MIKSFSLTDRCGGKLEGSQGTFTSPNYPEFYPSDSDCTWKITVPAKSKIELSIDNIALEPGFDYVDVYDGPTLTSKFLKRLHGVRRPNPLLSSGNQMVVRFVSDESVQNVGFSARYKAGELFSLLTRFEQTVPTCERWYKMILIRLTDCPLSVYSIVARARLPCVGGGLEACWFPFVHPLHRSTDP